MIIYAQVKNGVVAGGAETMSQGDTGFDVSGFDELETKDGVTVTIKPAKLFKAENDKKDKDKKDAEDKIDFAKNDDDDSISGLARRVEYLEKLTGVK